MKKLANNTTKVVITWGGGMGGSSVTGYATKIEEDGDQYIMHFVGNTTGPVTVNRVWVVYMQPGYDVYEDVQDNCLRVWNQAKGAVDTDDYDGRRGCKRVTFPN